MSKRTSLRNAIASIQPNQARILPREQHFAPPPATHEAPNTENAGVSQGKQTQGSLTQVQLTQGNLTQVDLPQGELTGVQTTLDDPLTNYLKGQKRNRRTKMIEGAVQLGGSLAPEAQDALVKAHIADGWGRLAHCVTRQLKAPGRFGLKLVDVAVILAIYDRTIAQVVPRMFAPISAQELEAETGMDESNIRAALRELVKREIISKIPYKTLNFWGINHSYFDRHTGGRLTQGESTQVESTQGNAPHAKQGDLPRVGVGQSNPPQTASSAGNNSAIKPLKNLLKESKKESLSCEIEYPADMQSRWDAFDHAGKYGNTTKEREIFEELFLEHKADFFSHCGRVVAFLEQHGNGKAGEEGKVYNPMAYLKGHWELNLSRYHSWVQRQEALKLAQAKLAEAELHQQEQQALAEKEQEIASQTLADHKAKIEADTQRFLCAYSTESERKTFIEQAVDRSQCEFTLSSWRKQGWESPVVRNCVLAYFLDPVVAEVASA